MGEKLAWEALNNSRRSALAAEKVCSWGLMLEALNVAQSVFKVHQGGVGPRPLQQARHPVGGSG